MGASLLANRLSPIHPGGAGHARDPPAGPAPCSCSNVDPVWLRRPGRSRVASACADVLWFRPLGRPTLPNDAKQAKVLPRTSGFSLRRKMPSLYRSSRGMPRWAIPGPSRLSRHPSRSTPETPLPLGLLNGAFGACGCFSGSLQGRKTVCAPAFFCRSGPFPRPAGKAGVSVDLRRSRIHLCQPAAAPDGRDRGHGPLLQGGAGVSVTPPTAARSRTSRRTARRFLPRCPRGAARRCSGTAQGRCRCRSPWR